jgi:hypothetical protein
MKVSDWVSIAQREAGSYRHVVCEFCGAETLAAGPVGFCSNCESVVGSRSKTVEGSNPALFSLLGSLRTALLKNDFETAEAIYDQLLKDRSRSQLLYAKGLMEIQHSNYLVSQIGYAQGSRMERNSELREKSALLFSEGKKLIAKSRSVSEAEAKGVPSAYASYRIFLCDLKMGDLGAASWQLKRIVELDQEGTVGSYAKIVLNVCGDMYREAELELEHALRTKNPPANAFYYAAFVAFKKGDPKGAERILGASGGLIEEQKKANLLGTIKEFGFL